MPHRTITDTGAIVAIQQGAIVSKVVHRDDQLNVTVFGLDAGEELSEHRASRTAIVQVISGELAFIMEGEDLEAKPGFWLHMTPGTPHAIRAVERSVMLLTLLAS